MVNGTKTTINAGSSALEQKRSVLADLLQKKRGNSASSFAETRLASLNDRWNGFKEKGHYFFHTEVQAYDGAWVVVDGKRMLMLASYSYLGLIGHPKVNAAAHAAIQTYGTGTHGVRMLAGTTSIHRELEQAIARFKHTDDAIVYSSGFMTNLATVSSLVGRGDVVIGDQFNHASIVDGCQFSQAEFMIFEHNRMDALEICLQKAGNAGKLVVVDGVFSMDGDVTDLPRVVELCKQYDALLMVDEAHSLGVLGATGHGIEEHFGLSSDAVDIKMGTLSKTIPGAGGYVAGKANLIHALKHNARGFVFSAALPTPIAAAAKAAFEVMETELEWVQRLHENVAYYVQRLNMLGFNTLGSQTAVVPVVCSDEATTFAMTGYCREAGLFVVPVIYPAVPMSSPRLRTCVSAAHSKDDLDFALSVLEKGGKQLGII